MDLLDGQRSYQSLTLSGLFGYTSGWRWEIHAWTMWIPPVGELRLAEHPRAGPGSPVSPAAGAGS